MHGLYTLYKHDIQDQSHPWPIKKKNACVADQPNRLIPRMDHGETHRENPRLEEVGVGAVPDGVEEPSDGNLSPSDLVLHEQAR